MGESSGGDSALADRIVAGDQDALAEIFNDFGGAVKVVAHRVLRNEVLAEDVVQDVFIGFWNSPERYDPTRGSLRTYLLTIAHRRAVDIVRSEVARMKRESLPPEDNPVDVEEEVWSRQLSSEVMAALDDLSRDEQVAIGLAYFGGLSYTEVARRLGSPEGTVKSRIRNGMKKLAVSLEGGWHADGT